MYGLMSDTHCHDWGAFSEIDEHGVNSRLKIILDQMLLAARSIKQAGGNQLYHGGDCFHERDRISPAVLNPVLETVSEILGMGIEMVLIAGNHDLSTRHATWNSNASSALSHLGATIIVEPTVHNDVLFVPWMDSVKKVRETLQEWAKKAPGVDVVIHAPLNGVIRGIPDTGLDPTQLANLGFKRVFCWHYHHHKNHFDQVYSIGALTHQTWGDIDTLAGFLHVRDDCVIHHESAAPKFVQYDPNNRDLVKGNYIRANAQIKHHSEVDKYRRALMGLGAAGVVIHPTLKANQTRVQSTVQAGASIRQSVSDWIQSNVLENQSEMTALCETILDEVEI